MTSRRNARPARAGEPGFVLTPVTGEVSWESLLGHRRHPAMRQLAHGLRGASSALVLVAAGPAPAADDGPPRRFAFEQPHMGTLWRVTLYAPSEDGARRAAEAAFARVAEVEDALSDYDAGSETRRLEEGWNPASPVLVDSLRQALRFTEMTGGAFDVTQGRLTHLWKRALRRRELPRDDRLEQARAAGGVRHVRVEHGRVWTGSPHTRLDFGAIGKGIALDAARRELADRFGLESVLIDAGGDVRAGAPPPGENGWTVRVHGHGEPLMLVVADAAVATSGDLHQSAEIDGVVYSHLIDPRSGRALADGATATVVAPDATTADALASAFCVLDREAAGRVLRTANGAAAYVSRRFPPDDRPQSWRSDGFPGTRP